MLPFLLLVMISGFAVTLVNGWGPLYRWNLFFHPALGIAASLFCIFFVRRKLRHLVPSASSIRWLDSSVALAVFFALPNIIGRSPNHFFLFLSAIAVVFLVGFLILHRNVPRPNRTPFLFTWLESALWTLLLFTGLAIITLSQGGGVKHLFLSHQIVAVFFAGVFVLRLALSLSTPLLGDAGLTAFHLPASRTIWITSSFVVVLAGIVVYDRSHHDPSFTIHLSTIPLESRESEARQMYFSDPSFEPAGMDLTLSCTTMPGCHKELKQGFLDSNHNISLMTPHFQKNLETLIDEIGSANTMICAGCHIPLAHFDKNKDYRYFENHNNFSCSFCHIIGEVSVNNADPRKSSYTIRPPVRHLSLFLEDGKERQPDRWTARQIRLSPLSHGRAFMKDLYRENRYCVTCHHHQIHLAPEEGLERPRCIACHMQPQSDLGMEGPLANHFMPGANLTVPFFAGREQAVRTIDRWMRGEFMLNMKGWENTWKPRIESGTDSNTATWLYLFFESRNDAVPGGTVTIDILTTNVGMEHSFPAAPLDLVEAWLEVHILDGEGKTVFQSGFIGEDGRIDPDAHTLGGYMIGMDDHVVIKNRVWQIKKKVTQRILKEGRQTVDTFTFRIPEDAAGPLRISAHWNYRKLNQDFILWAYGPAVDPPIVRIGSLLGELPLEIMESSQGTMAPSSTAKGS